IVSVALYKPLGIAGLVIGTASANVVMTALQLHRLRLGLNGYLEGGQTLMITVRILLATVIMAAVAWGVWHVLDVGLGHTSLLAQIVAVGVACAVACALYGWLALKMRIPEARQIQQLVVSRVRGG
ncbi:MAG: polysaccharide biosynthesis C-terminal domain-containing protein, partial [Solirubrobacteraceae bacterium]